MNDTANNRERLDVQEINAYFCKSHVRATVTVTRSDNIRHAHSHNEIQLQTFNYKHLTHNDYD